MPLLDAADAPAWTAEWSVAYGSDYHGCPLRVIVAIRRALGNAEDSTQAALVRCVFANPFRSGTLDRNWLTPDVVELAHRIYEDRAFGRLPELANALADAGCANADFLAHCREPGPHVRGCWAVDLVLGKR